MSDADRGGIGAFRTPSDPRIPVGGLPEASEHLRLRARELPRARNNRANLGQRGGRPPGHWVDRHSAHPARSVDDPILRATSSNRASLEADINSFAASSCAAISDLSPKQPCQASMEEASNQRRTLLWVWVKIEE